MSSLGRSSRPCLTSPLHHESSRFPQIPLFSSSVSPDWAMTKFLTRSDCSSGVPRAFSVSKMTLGSSSSSRSITITWSIAVIAVSRTSALSDSSSGSSWSHSSTCSWKKFMRLDDEGFLEVVDRQPVVHRVPECLAVGPGGPELEDVVRVLGLDQSFVVRYQLRETV